MVARPEERMRESRLSSAIAISISRCLRVEIQPKPPCASHRSPPLPVLVHKRPAGRRAGRYLSPEAPKAHVPEWRPGARLAAPDPRAKGLGLLSRGLQESWGLPSLSDPLYLPGCRRTVTHHEAP